MNGVRKIKRQLVHNYVNKIFRVHGPEALGSKSKMKYRAICKDSEMLAVVMAYRKEMEDKKR